MTGNRAICVVLVAGALLAAIGCAHRKAGPAGGPAEPVAQVTEAARVAELRSRADAFASFERKLPGNTEQEHRQLMAVVFSQAGPIIRQLHGPDEDGDFVQQQRIIAAAAARLANGPADLITEPVIDSALRAAYTSLRDLARKDFAADESVQPPLNSMQEKLSDLDTLRGPLHRVVAGEAAELMGETFQAMTSVLEGRLSPATTALATTAPVPTPATAP